MVAVAGYGRATIFLSRKVKHFGMMARLSVKYRGESGCLLMLIRASDQSRRGFRLA